MSLSTQLQLWPQKVSRVRMFIESLFRFANLHVLVEITFTWRKYAWQALGYNNTHNFIDWSTDWFGRVYRPASTPAAMWATNIIRTWDRLFVAATFEARLRRSQAIWTKIEYFKDNETGGTSILVISLCLSLTSDKAGYLQIAFT